MLSKLLQDRINLEKEISKATIAELQSLVNQTGITIDMGMGSITFEKNDATVYYHDVFSPETMNANPRHPKTLDEFINQRKFNNPYISKAEAIAEYNEESWHFCELKKEVAKTFYALICQLDLHYSSDGYPALWDICGSCTIKPQ